jgi:predicted RNA polymerase sigma factor
MVVKIRDEQAKLSGDWVGKPGYSAQLASAVSLAQKPRKGVGWIRKTETWRPANAEAFLVGGCMRRLEYVAGAKAADEAIREERRSWLPQLEKWLAEADPDDPYHSFLSAGLRSEIKRLRKALKIRPTLDERREQSRERVRRFRKRQRENAESERR